MAMALTRIPEASKAPANLYIHIKQNQMKCIWHGKQRHHVTLAMLCTGWMPRKTGGRSVLHLNQIKTDIMYK